LNSNKNLLIYRNLGLDADYVEYLKQRRREEREREQTLTTEQRQSLTFFSILN